VTRKVYYLIWILLLFVLLIQGAPRLWSDLKCENFPARSPTAAIDRQLEPILQVAGGSSLLTKALAQLPGECRVIVAYPAGNEQWEFVECAMAYLSWPRKIETMKLKPNESFTGVLTARTVVFLCGLPVPSDTTYKRTNIAPNLELLRPLDVE
jgi:hypothetical protein